jgi:hypothetical protein
MAMAGLAWWASLPAPAAGGATPPAMVYTLTLAGAAGEGKALSLHLDASGSTIHAACGTGFNALVHQVDASKLHLTDRAVTGEVTITVRPDNYLPSDGRQRVGTYRIRARREGEAVVGSFTGQFGTSGVQGSITGHVAPRPSYDTPHGLDVRLFGALHRLYSDRGPSWKYALDMRLRARMKEGRAVRPRFETIVPDYRRYSAVVESADLRLKGNRLRGTFRARVDYGGQGRAKEFENPVETHTYTLRGRVVGQVVGGTYDVAIGEDYRAEGEPFAGRLDFAPLPEPNQSIATLRLHDAMAEGPVLLTLSLADDGLINGLAYASGYNHQPHAVDASGLRLDRDRLHGPVTVSIFPDCYKPPERFTLSYRLNGRIIDDAIEGAFTGRDRGRDVTGRITGKLRAKRTTARPVTPETLTSAHLQLGYCLMNDPSARRNPSVASPNHAEIHIAFEDDEPSEVTVAHPHAKEVFAADVVATRLRIDGDRLIGRVVFDLESDLLQDGRYAFGFDAIVDGHRLIGFWRGTCDGRDILTKSAKLGGTVQARQQPPAAPPEAAEDGQPSGSRRESPPPPPRPMDR